MADKAKKSSADKTAKSGITHEDVLRLSTDTSPAARRATVEKLAATYSGGALTDQDRVLAMEIFHVFARDAEQRVREALSASLKSLPDLPHDLALTLARDVAAVATPILQETAVLTVEDLIGIVQDGDSQKQVAVARRKHVPEPLADALVDSGSEAVVATVVANPGAEVGEAALDKAIAAFPDSDAVKEGMVQRPGLPLAIAEKLVTLVSEKLREHLVTHHALSPDHATDLILETRERAIMGLLREDGATGDAEALARELHKNGRLSESLMLRAACLGDIDFVEAGLAAIAKIPVENARRLVHDAGRRGLMSLMSRAGLPSRLALVLQSAIQVAEETDYDGLDHDRERYALRMVERVLTALDDTGDGDVSNDDIDYLIRKMDTLRAQAAA
ncbi:MAG: DUF2336 domain-containing protein [Alphaproteobacteria bacterium]|nr:DUF2336 domain-containing protein [Alphaproteobacteria bacterium]